MASYRKPLVASGGADVAIKRAAIAPSGPFVIVAVTAGHSSS